MAASQACHLRCIYSICPTPLGIYAHKLLSTTLRSHRTKERRLLQAKSLFTFYRHVNKKLCCGHRIVQLRQADDSVVTNDASKSEAFNAYVVTVFTQPIPDAPIDQPASGPNFN